MLSPETIKAIQEEAEKHQKGSYQWQIEKRLSFIAGASLYADKLEEADKEIEFLKMRIKQLNNDLINNSPF